MFFNHALEPSAAVAEAVRSADYGDADVEFSSCDARDRPEGIELAVSIGGDGTFLLTSKTIMGTGVPVFGINTGRLGFLASGEAQNAVRDVKSILSGGYDTFAMVPIRGEISRNGGPAGRVWALNEIMIVKGLVSRPISITARLGRDRLYSFLADGIIVATPTGSTAYALSAGGPIVHPGLRCISVTPICPHSLYPRPLVAPDTETVTITLEPSQCGAILSGDGQNDAELLPGDDVSITSDPDRKIDVIKLGAGSYIDVLRSKLNWS
ncbi:MAG: NAD(+)/NADH kinase [Synergistaceae bacterium]|nr:NAD(+)/NADH kinase [Synergistaceae bacterium]